MLPSPNIWDRWPRFWLWKVSLGAKNATSVQKKRPQKNRAKPLQQFNTPPNRWWFQRYVQIFHRSQFVILYFRLPRRYFFVEIGWPFSPTNPPPSWPTMATIHGALKALASLKFPLITRVVGVTDDNTFLPRLCCVPLCCVLKLGW